VSDEVLEERRQALLDAGGYFPRNRERVVSPALRAYAVMAQSADKGAVRDVAVVEAALQAAAEREPVLS
jgi:dihydroxy-acid dehydratase